MPYTSEKVPPRVKYVVYGLLGIVILLILRMLAPFNGAIIGATTLGITFYPVYRRLDRWMPKRSSSLKALLADVWVMFILLVPFVLLTWMVVQEAEQLSPLLTSWQKAVDQWREGKVTETIPTIRDFNWWLYKTAGVTPSQFRQQLMALVNSALGSVSSLGAGVASGMAAFVMNVGLMLITLFFVFRDGPRLYQQLLSNIPLNPQNKMALTEKMELTIHGMIRGWFVTALAQGMAAMVGYFMVGAPAAAFFGVLTMFSSLIPTVGSALVWLPLSVVMMVKGMYFKGVFLIVYGTVVVGLLDNVLRPYLVGKRVELPFLFLFFALLGGLEVWGLKGMIIGPVIVAIAPLLLEIHRHISPPPATLREKAQS